MSLATRKRPTKLSEIVEQDLVKKIIGEQIKQNKIRNVYIITGNSGVGKTTLARAVSLEINNGIASYIELDAASNNGVDQIRAITESASKRNIYSDGEYKIFILDECHMLSSNAWAALLKCLEDCPKYTIFFLCSTDPEKIPITIKNRAQCFSLAPISVNGIKNRLIQICKEEGFTNYEQTCDLISKTSNGGLRTAISYLEQVADYSTDLSIEIAKKILSSISYESMFKLTWALKDNKEEEIFNLIDSLYNNGQDLKHFIDCYLNFVLDLSKYILFKNIDITNIPSYLATEENAVVQFTTNINNGLDVFNFISDRLVEIKAQIRNDQNYKSTILVLLLRLSRDLKGSGLLC